MLLSGRKKRKTSLMKPSEVTEYDRLPNHIAAYRAHRVGKQTGSATRWTVPHGMALFLRCKEQKLIALWPKNARRLAVHAVLYSEDER